MHNMSPMGILLATLACSISCIPRSVELCDSMCERTANTKLSAIHLKRWWKISPSPRHSTIITKDLKMDSNRRKYHLCLCTAWENINTHKHMYSGLEASFVLKCVCMRYLTTVCVLPSVPDGKLKPLYLAMLTSELPDCFEENSHFI